MNFIFDTLSSRCLWDSQVEMATGQVAKVIGSSGKASRLEILALGFEVVQTVVKDYFQIRLLEGTTVRKKIEHQGGNSREHSNFLITKSADLSL